MALQNIGAANSDDAFYRYKMPKMITKIEGRGNGIKTNIVNMVDIAKALARPATYTTKYFGCELGAQSKFDEKTGISLVNGAHDTAKLAGLLENFIKKYVQCYGCGNPETEVIITKMQMIHLKCAACGFVSEVNMRDRLTTFILKNPPETKKGSKDKKVMRRAEKERLKEGEAADEEQKKLKKEIKKNVPPSTSFKDVTSKSSAARKIANSLDEDRGSPRSQDGDHEAVGDDDDDVQWQTDTSAEAARQRIIEQLSAVTAEMVMLSTTEKDTERKQNKEPEAANGNHFAKENQNNCGKLFAEFRDFLKKDPTPMQLAAFFLSVTGSPQETMAALVEAIFEGIGKGFAREVGKKKCHLAAVVKDTGSQVLLLLAIEYFCGKSDPDATKEVALVAKVLYDEDVLEEEQIMHWYQEGIAGTNKTSPIWKNIKPFIEWLASAESESDEE